MVIDIHTHNVQANVQTLDTVGVHPWYADSGNVSDVERRAAEADAIGEIGLDFACDTSREEQKRIFVAQLALAERLEKPVVLHCVRAFEEAMQILKIYHLKAVIFHGFIGSVEQAQRAVRQGYFLSFGERTFRSPKTIEALRSTPLSHLFVETDESNTPIAEIYARIAELRGISTDLLIRTTQENFERIKQQV